MPGGVAGIDEEIAVHFRDLRSTDAQAPAAGGVDQFPGAVAGWILEGRSSRLFANRLSRFAMALHLVHPRANGLGVRDRALKARRREDDRRVDAAVAVDELHVGIAENMPGAVAADADSLDQNVLGLVAIGAGIHPQRAADGAGDAEEEFHAADVC